MHMHYVFGSHIYSLSSMATCVLLGRHISFSLFMPKSFEIVHTCVYIQNSDAHERLTVSNILHLKSLFVPFTSMLPLAFHAR